MSGLTLSVVIVSRRRPEALRLCLTAVGQLLHPAFEVIVVADAPGLGLVRDLGWQDRIKTVAFEEANISAARNLGIAAAAGDVVAFLDDDAVPEPTWASHICAPFAVADVAAAGGFVRGRNGISFQWTARDARSDASCTALEVDRTRVTLLSPKPGRGIKTEGTNMAFRRTVLAEMGGFDPAFRFYLDDTDLNQRLANGGHRTAVVPLAQVVHGFARGPHRRDDRVPRDLFETGASLRVFLRKHADKGRHGPRWDSFRDRRRKWLLEHMVAGRLQPGDVRWLLRRLHQGWEAGRARDLSALPAIPKAREGLRPFVREGATGEHHLLAGRLRQRRQLARAARDGVAAGHIVTVLRLTSTALWHRLRFHPDGYWLQTGGRFGRAARDEPLFRWRGVKRRAAEELSRIGGLRGAIPPD